MLDLIDAIGLDTILVIVVLGLLWTSWGLRRKSRNS
jgi:hypothetical protein